MEKRSELTQNFFGREFSGLDTNPKSELFKPIAIQYVRTRTMLTAVIPAMIACITFSFLIGWHALWLLIWIPLYALANWQLYRRYGIQVAADGFSLRRGFLGYRITSFLYRKVQRVSVTQTIFQKRKGLATMRFYLASGTVKVPYVDNIKAKQLRDYVLYCVESSRLAWH